MEFEQIIELIHAVSDSRVTDFKLEENGFKLSIETGATIAENIPKAASADTACTMERNNDFESSFASKEVEQPAGNVIKSPLVGTFYRASSPESAPFVEVGDVVEKGQVLGIVEAMKLMNEIESEYSGTVKEILVENGQLTEYGQPLFVIG